MNTSVKFIFFRSCLNSICIIILYVKPFFQSNIKYSIVVSAYSQQASLYAHLATMDISKNSGCVLQQDPNLRLPLWPSAEAAQKWIMCIWNQSDISRVRFCRLNPEQLAFTSEPKLYKVRFNISVAFEQYDLLIVWSIMFPDLSLSPPTHNMLQARKLSVCIVIVSIF